MVFEFEEDTEWLLPGHSCATKLSEEQGLKSFWYTCLPYAVTIIDAVTFCAFSLVPATSKSIFFVARLNDKFNLFTMISEFA